MSSRVVIVGAGFAGIGMAIRLLQSGERDVVVIEASDGVGGTWRHNTYPGAGCDVPSHLYSFSFHPKPDWSRRYATQPEILAYLEDCVRHFGLAPHLRLGTEVTRAQWDGARARWDVELSTGEVLEADVVISAVGQLNRPHYPEIPGTFAGPAFHSAQWDHGVDLTGKRVGVIGTGASAIQFVPAIVGTAAHVTVFQRSAPYTVRKRDRAYTPVARRTFRRVPALLAASRALQYAEHEARAVGFVSSRRMMDRAATAWRRQMERAVPDPRMREQVTPDYVIGCKRVLLTNDWYDVLQRPDVTLVTDRVASLRPDGVETAAATVHECDVLVFGTGFRATEFLTPMQVVGRNGTVLHDRWRSGADAHLGITVSGFPNFFLLYGPQTNLGHSSIIYMIESQIGYVLQAVRALSTYRLASMDVRAHVQDRWRAQVRERSRRTVWETGCRSWYTTPDGRNVNNWPGYTFSYRRLVRHLDLADYETQGMHEITVTGATTNTSGAA